MSISESETWVAAVGLEGRYEVSDRGRMRSIPRVTVRRDGKPLPVRSRVLKTHTDKKGYVLATVAGGDRRVHRHVCRSFNGEPGEGETHVRHLDGNPGNNTPSNLAWGTPKDNAQDTIRLGRNWNQRKTHCPRGHLYTADEVRNVRICVACRKERRETGGHPSEGSHGKYSTYLNWGCRCGDCRESFSEYQRGYRSRRAHTDV